MGDVAVTLVRKNATNNSDIISSTQAKAYWAAVARTILYVKDEEANKDESQAE